MRASSIHLCGEKGSVLCSIAEVFAAEYTKDYYTVQEATEITDASIWYLLFLYTHSYFEIKHADIFKTGNYKSYSLITLLERYKEYHGSHSTYYIWNALRDILRSIEQTNALPSFFVDVLSTRSKEYFSSSIGLSDSQLYSIIQHILENIRSFPLENIQELGVLYEELSVYSLIYSSTEWICTIESLGRKNTGRYYTPQKLAQHVSEYAITKALLQEEYIHNLRIIDNSCGTGIFLQEILSCAMESIRESQESTAYYYSLLEEQGYINPSFADIQRYIAERIIYGVDINPLAVAVARYILGVLTFVKHEECIDFTKHIRVGNALLGASYQQVYTTATAEEQMHLNNAYTGLCTAITENNREQKEQCRNILSSIYTNSLMKELYTLYTIDERTMAEEAFSIFTSDIFHYDLEFPEIFFFEKKGFTSVIGNPPWEKIKFEHTLFWEQYNSGYGSRSEKEKQSIRANETHGITANKSFLQAISSLHSTYYKEAYPLSRGVGDDNIFRFFIERALYHIEGNALLHKCGFLLYIIPTGFMTEESSTKIRIFCIEERYIEFFIGFENRDKIFSDVDSRYKFGIVCICAEPALERPIHVCFMQRTLKKIEAYTEDMLSIGREDLYMLSQESLCMPEIRTVEDITILNRLYLLHPALSEDYLTVRRELDCAIHRELFYEEYSDCADIPLYRGAMIWQYNSVYAKPKYYMSSVTVDTLLQSREVFRLLNDVYKALPLEYKKKYIYCGKTASVLQFFSMEKADCLQYIVPDRLCWRFAIRAIARNTDERSVIASLLPCGSTYQNSLCASLVKKYTIRNEKIYCEYIPIARKLYGIAVCNSLVYNWLMRFISAINISKAYIHKIPFPQPSDASLNEEPYSTLIANTLRLQMNNDAGAFTHLGKEFGIEENSLSRAEEESLLITNECLVAQLYEISQKELHHIMMKEYFAVLHSKKGSYVERFLDSYANLQ